MRRSAGRRSGLRADLSISLVVHSSQQLGEGSGDGPVALLLVALLCRWLPLLLLVAAADLTVTCLTLLLLYVAPSLAAACSAAACSAAACFAAGWTPHTAPRTPLGSTCYSLLLSRCCLLPLLLPLLPLSCALRMPSRYPVDKLIFPLI